MNDLATTISVCLLHLVTPASLTLTAIDFIATTWHVSPTSSLPWGIRSYIYAESLFWALQMVLSYRTPLTRPPITPVERKRAWTEVIRGVRGKAGVEVWLAGWFVRTSPAGRWATLPFVAGVAGAAAVRMEEIHRGNVEELLAGLFFNLSLVEIKGDPLSLHSLTAMVFALEAKRNHRFQTGYNPSLRPLPRTPTPQHRPLVLYLVSAVLHWTADFVLAIAGFQRYSGPVGYHYHPGLLDSGSGILCYILRLFRDLPSDHKPKTPIIILHGLGGYAPLVHLVLALLPLHRPIFLIHQPHLSLRLSFCLALAPSMADMVKGVNEILESHGFGANGSSQGGLLLAHSLGSGLAAALSSHSAHNSTFETVLIDPISIRLFDPNLSRAVFSVSPATPFAQWVRYLVNGRGVSQYLSDHFNPFESSLSLSPTLASGHPNLAHTRVILARNDPLIPVPAIQRDCQANGISCEVLENANHGSFLYTLPLFCRVLDVLRAASADMLSANRAVSISDRAFSHMTAPAIPTIVIEAAPQIAPTRSKSRIVSLDQTPRTPCSPVLTRNNRSRSRTLGVCDARASMMWSRSNQMMVTRPAPMVKVSV